MAWDGLVLAVVRKVLGLIKKGQCNEMRLGNKSSKIRRIKSLFSFDSMTNDEIKMQHFHPTISL